MRGSAEDTIAALDAGADDYLTNPFGTGELTARIRAALVCEPPVIAADTAIYRALWGGRAQLVDPADADAWVDAVRRPQPRPATHPANVVFPPSSMNAVFPLFQNTKLSSAFA